ncbi:MAG: hypothetical protein J6X55_05055 [Victivallales bacterium]|nr:hypothetical protein [Victivallales bacterium]
MEGEAVEAFTPPQEDYDMMVIDHHRPEQRRSPKSDRSPRLLYTLD